MTEQAPSADCPPSSGAAITCESPREEESEPMLQGSPPAARPREIGGREGPDPTRYGDWELKGRCIDF